MNGRIYDYKPGIPICKVCKSIVLRSEETNFNGIYCPTCKMSPEYGGVDYDLNHPIWIKWKEYIESCHGKLVSFDYGIKELKKDHGFSDKKI